MTALGKKWWMKFVLLMVVTLSAIVYLIPTLKGFDPATSSYPVKKRINLGLDLQGGVYMVLGVDFQKVFNGVVQRQAESLTDEFATKKIECSAPVVQKSNTAVDDPRILVECKNAAAKEELRKLVKRDDLLRLTDDRPQHYEFGLTKTYRDNVREKTINQSIEVIRNRIDEFGVSEPVITSQGVDRLSVELPGIKDVDRAKELIGRTAKLEFKIVADDQKNPDEVAALISQIESKNSLAYKEGEKFSDYVRKVNELAKGQIPANTEIAFQKEERRGRMQGQFGRVPYLLYSNVEVTGDDLKDAFIQMDPQDNRPQVGLSFNSKGAQNFEKVTGEHLQQRMAIVLDGIVHSAPVIQSRIAGGRAQITLGQGEYNDMLQEAKDLSIVLRAGALPAQLDFLEQRVVGPSLGQDSIEKGKLASIVGCLAVFLFMLVYYRFSGVIADISLVLNVILVLAILVGIDATLTLPGIAGIALTVGIAVDSNVVIYERIREELRRGKPVRAAVDSGFEKAFHTILDANVTNAFAAIVLMNFGTGPIKGFAVTLLIGIITTVFTAVFASKLMFDFYLDKFKVKELSI